MTAEVMHVVEAPAERPDAAARLIDGLRRAAGGAGQTAEASAGLALVVVFVSPNPRAGATMRALSEALAPTPVIGCTTAGEIGRGGYAEGSIVAIGLPARHFRAAPLLIPDLGRLDPQAVIGEMIRARGALREQAPDWGHEFAFLMVDGLSTREDALTAALSPGLGAVPLFGGSAADGARFVETLVYFGGRALRNAAVLTMVRSACPVRVFKFDHFTPTARRMVVTGADPARRLVQSINAEPAAREYARLLGKDPHQLTPFIFAAHPVVVRFGGQHHVRSIRQVDENGDLVFFSAIDEGMVLTLAEPRDMVSHLAEELGGLARRVRPAGILACDCVLRRIEVQEKQRTGEMSALLRAYRVAGFSTYGEQFNSMHVNQTLTGVALYPPGSTP